MFSARARAGRAAAGAAMPFLTLAGAPASQAAPATTTSTGATSVDTPSTGALSTASVVLPMGTTVVPGAGGRTAGVSR